MKRCILWCLFWACVLSFPSVTEAAIWKRKKKQAEEKTVLSNYDKLFKGKVYESAAGEFVTVHKIEGKVYIEYPLRLLGRELLLASTTTASTDHSVCTNGYKENVPLHIRFTLNDGHVWLRKINAWITTDSNKSRVHEAIEQNFSDPVTHAYKVLAYSPDSLAVVFDMTELFLNGEPLLSPIPRRNTVMKVTAAYAANLSSVREIKAFEDNISVKSQLNYTYTVARDQAPLVKDQPLTVEVTRTLLLLPEQKMRPRLSDRRIGTFLTLKRYLSENGEPIGKYSYANRWRVEPKDSEAHARGELTEPVRPIVFYLDTLFPLAWREPIRQGVLRWNKAFEKIGLKNVLQVRDFPADDLSFDPDNLKYSCIRYVPTAVANAMGPSWVDPSTGEIVNASVLIYHDVVRMIRNWRFVQTAQVDPSVRGKELPDAIRDESLSYVVAHEIGHSLGLMHNMAASAAYPVDSLRSVGFTRKYGTTPSIMDYARFNYVAQPEDQGVRLTPPDLGVYDEFVIRWLYACPVGNLTIWEEAKMLEGWVDEKANDPMYRYGRQQLQARYDPSALEEDLGDDPLKAGDYGIRNLQYIISRMNGWLTDDPDATDRKQLYDQIVSQYYRYIRNVIYNIGGIYLWDAKKERCQPVPRDIQKASVAWVLNQVKHLGWIDEPALLRKFPLSVAPSVMLAETIGKQLNMLHPQLTLASSLTDDPYGVEEYFDDLYEGIWESAIRNKPLTTVDRILQTQLLSPLSEQIKTIGGIPLGISLADIYCYGLQPSGTIRQDTSFFSGSGYGWQQTVDTSPLEETPAYYLRMLMKIKHLLESQMATFTEEDQVHYQAMLFAVKQILGKQSQNN